MPGNWKKVSMEDWKKQGISFEEMIMLQINLVRTTAAYTTPRDKRMLMQLKSTIMVLDSMTKPTYQIKKEHTKVKLEIENARKRLTAKLFNKREKYYDALLELFECILKMLEQEGKLITHSITDVV